MIAKVSWSFWRKFSPIPYIKNVANDYAVVFRELAIETRQRPLKALFWTGVIASGVYFQRTNPGHIELKARLAELRHQLLLVPKPIQNPRAAKCLQRYTDLLNTNRLAYYDCLLFTLVVRRPYDKKCNLYATQDSNLRDWLWYELWENTVDIGALNRFWMLEHGFVDYDICEDEFTIETVAPAKSLPVEEISMASAETRNRTVL